MSLERQGIRHQVMWELGECCRLLFAVHKKDKLTGDPERWSVQSHTDVDGVGAITKILTKENVNVTNLPRLKNTEKPNWIKRLIYFYKYAKYCSGYNIIFKQEVNWDLIEHPKYLCYTFFSKNVSDKINNLLKKKKISSTAFFLQIADEINSNYFLTAESERKWIVPVNMRGPFGEKLDTRNIFSSVIFKFFPHENVTSQLVHEKFKYFLKSNFHWGSWVSGLIQAYMGHERLKKIAAKYPKAVFGLFSNVGKWPSEYIKGDCPVHLAVMPVTTRVAPVGITMMEFHGQFQIALMIHPCIDKENDTTKYILTEIIKSSLAKAGFTGEDLAAELNAQQVKQFEIDKILEGGLTNG